MLLFSLVLIYLSGLALNTLISCLVSFLLPVHVTTTSQVIFLPLKFMNGYKRHSAGTTWASIMLRLRCSCVARHGCATFTGLSQQKSPLTTQLPLSPEASPPSEPKGNRVTREDRADRNRERERRERLKRDEDDRRNER